MGFIRLLLKRKLIVGLMVFFILLLGVFATTKLDQELMPAIIFDGAMIDVDAGGMTTLDVEKRITEPIEQTLIQIDGVESYQSTSSVGHSTITITAEEGRGEEVSKEVESTLNGLKTQLVGVRNIQVIPFSTNGSYEFFMDVSNGTKEQMTVFSRDILKKRLEALPEVREVDLVGIDEKEIIIELKQDQLSEFGIEVEQVVSAIQMATRDLSLGVLKGEENDPTVRLTTSIHSKEDVGNISVVTTTGVKKIRDFSYVQERSSEHSVGVWKNGSEDFIFAQIKRVPNVTQVEMAAAIRTEVEKIRDEGLVSGFTLGEVVAQADYVSDSIEGVSQNVLIGGVLALIMLLLFLRNIRAMVIIGLSIPLSILLTFSGMWFFDYSFNMLSLIGLGLGIGMMVDASIVILESIFRKKEQGITNREAVIQGTREVATAVIASMLTTVVVFLPIGLLGGEAGQFMIILSVVVILTLVSSVVVSFTLIPSLSENFLRVKEKEKKEKEGKIVAKYGSFIGWMGKRKRNRYGMIVMFFLVFASSLTLITKIPMTIMPDVFNRYAEVMIQLETGVTPAEREDIAIAISSQLEDVTDVTNTIVMDNINVIYAIINMSPAEEAILEQSEVNDLIFTALRELEDEYPIVSVGSAMGMGGGLPIALEIKGENIEKLSEISGKLTDELKKVAGVVGVTSSNEKSLSERHVTLNEEAIEADNLTPLHISTLIEQVFTRMSIANITTADNEWRNLILATDQKIDNEDQLLSVELTLPNGETEKLEKYITLDTIEAPTQIDRKDGERYVMVMADFEGRDLGAVNRDIQVLLNNFSPPDGYSVLLGGDLEAQQEAMVEMLMILGIALFLVYFVMAVQFNSLKHPLIVMSIIPMTITGVILGLFITQMELSIMSGMGIVMLIGIVLNNAILLIDRTNQFRRQGIDLNTAVLEAGKTRIRPIFMTTLTTVGGMLPLALATGVASSYQAPLATVVISGLLFATLITLILIPSVYLLFEDVTRGMIKIITKGKRNQPSRKVIQTQSEELEK